MTTPTRSKQIPVDALGELQRRLADLPARSAERRGLIEKTAEFYNISTSNLYRLLRERSHPRLHPAPRTDKGRPRVIARAELERYCEIVAAMKERTANKKGRHLSTVRAIELLEEHGITTPTGFVRPATGLLTKSTVNRYLKAWGYDRPTLARESPHIRFQAQFSNDCWQFDLSHSDLKHLQTPPAWVDPSRGLPTLMLYSVVDDRSGACYQEYHQVYGEDVEAALRFLFNAMAVKQPDGILLHGIPKMIYTDNGPIARSRTFLNVMECLGIEVMTHQPSSQVRDKTPARAKGKVERPFKTVKEAHETLYHFHQPETEEEANRWLHNYLVRYNNQEHRSEPHSRCEDWQTNQPADGIREMCSWERFSTFAREPERRTVGNDARVSINGIFYEVDPELAGCEVTLWWGLFDDELFVELGENRFGPFRPAGGATRLHTYRKFKRTRREERAERIRNLAGKLDLPRAAVAGDRELQYLTSEPPATPSPIIAFRDPDPFQEFAYPNAISAKRAIADYLGLPLAKVTATQRAFIDSVVAESLNKKMIIERVKSYFHPSRSALPLNQLLEDAEEYVN